MSGQHANIKGAALTLPILLRRLLVEARAELAAERHPGRHAAHQRANGVARRPSAA